MGRELIVSSNETVQVYQMLPAGTTDAMVVDMWLHGHSANTQAAYARDMYMFAEFVGKPLRQVNLLDLQMFSDNLVWMEKSSRARAINAVKSLYTFCHRTGYLPVNVGAALRVKKVPTKLAGRILTEEQIFKLFLAMEDDPQKHCILRTLYYGALRVSELCTLIWVDIVPNGIGGQINVLGKGDKPRSVPIPRSPYEEILSLRGDVAIDAPVFPRRTGRALDRVQVYRIVSEAAILAGIEVYTNKRGTTCSRVSPHWLRHAHASHALNHGAPIQLVRDTLGHGNVQVTDQYAHARPNASSATFLPE